jgi:hypothetical protein
MSIDLLRSTRRFGVDKVRTLRLSVLIPIRNAACTSVNYTAFVNAHCIFERL